MLFDMVLTKRLIVQGRLDRNEQDQYKYLKQIMQYPTQMCL